MSEHNDTHAMTEVALALAMAFFSVMVVAMVGMSVGPATANSVETKAPAISSDESVRLVASRDFGQSLAEKSQNHSVNWIMFNEGKFFDSKGRQIDPGMITTDAPTVLAVAPNLAIEEMLDLVQQFSGADLRITALNREWIAFLEERQ